jgi:tRNA threonylcarbamoyladenosine biosynthesis protein TsaE
MNELILTTRSPQETMDLAYKLAKQLKRGTIITLEGELASGKTTFTKGFGKGLGISQAINSPTFTISKIYEGEFPLIHIDAYRLEGIDQELGFEEFFNDDWMVVVEWAQYIEKLLPYNCVAIKFTVVDDETREIRIKVPTELESLIKELK